MLPDNIISLLTELRTNGYHARSLTPNEKAALIAEYNRQVQAGRISGPTMLSSGCGACILKAYQALNGMSN